MPQDWFSQYESRQPASVTATISGPGGMAGFGRWYSGHAQRWGLDPDPDAPGQEYDYRAAFKAGAQPDETGRWPSAFKRVSLSAPPEPAPSPQAAAGEDWFQQFETPAASSPVTPDARGRHPLAKLGYGLLDIGKELQSLNPVAIVKGTSEALRHPITTGAAMLDAQGDLFRGAQESFEKGDYAKGVRQTINWLIPILGPSLDKAGDSFVEGRTAEGIGKTLDVGLQIAGPKVLKDTAATIKATRPLMKPAVPAEAEAVAFGERAGVPLDAATVTGNRFVKGVQKLADETLVGSVVSGKANQRQAEGLATIGEQLAAKARPGASVTSEQAGQGVIDALTARAARDAAARGRAGERLAGRTHPTAVTPEQAGQGVQSTILQGVRDAAGQADAAYEALRVIEADPKHIRRVTPKLETSGTAGARGRLTPGPHGRFAPESASMEDVFQSVLGDARRGGFEGSADDLRVAFAEQVRVARELGSEMQSAAEYGPMTLLADIRKYGGIRPFETDIAAGGPRRNLRGDFASVVESFGSKNGWGQRGGATVFRKEGLGLDQMVERLRQDPKWQGLIGADADLIEMLDDIARQGPAASGSKDIEHLLRASGVQPGSKWWSNVSTAAEVDMPLPVDLRAAKPALKVIRDRLMRQYPVAQQQASPGLKALNNIVDGPDFAPLSVADADLGAIKTIARSDIPELRSISQGVAARAVSLLDLAVKKTAQSAGPEAVRALEQGRAATVAKYAAGDVFEGIKAEPVKAFTQAMAPNDAAIGHLRQIADMAPSELPKMARAHVDELLQAEPKAAARQWAQTGPETRALLFKDPNIVKALDTYFKPGPAGSAAEVLKTLTAEPVKVFDQAAWARDAGIAKLRAINRLAPDELPKVGRAYLENMIDKATGEGAFGHAQKLLADWHKLGDQTKTLLFKDPAYIKELDDFFLLAKKISENPNPSGTALTWAKGGEVGLWYTNPIAGAATSLSAGALSKLLHSKLGVRLLTKGFRLPAGNKALTTAYAAELTKATGEAGSLVPALAGQPPTQTGRQ